MENERSYRGFNFFAERDLQVLEVISRGQYMTYNQKSCTYTCIGISIFLHRNFAILRKKSLLSA